MVRFLFPGGRTHALTLSYDDGVSSDIRLIETMKKHGIKGTFNINAGCMSGEGGMRGKEYVYRLRPEQIRETYQDMEIAIHGYTHPFFEQLPADLAAGEVIRDRMALEALAGYPVRGMAYPFGTYNEQVVAQLAQLGVAYSRTTVSTLKFDLPTNFLTWHATCHHRNPQLDELCDQFLEPSTRYSKCKLFYLWGHSYEFAQDDNWEVIERFCEKMGGREEIWYATNMEIYQYITAYKQVVCSVDGTMMYNPTCTDVWFKQGEKTLCVPAGKQVTLN